VSAAATTAPALNRARLEFSVLRKVSQRDERKSATAAPGCDKFKSYSMLVIGTHLATADYVERSF